MSDLKTRVNEILTTNGLDFTVEKLPLVAPRNRSVITDSGEIADEVQLIDSPYFGLYNSKSGEIINTVKKGYTVSQNDEVVELVLRGMDGFGELSVQKAGSLHGGRRVFIQLAIDGLSVVGDDRVKRYVTIIDSNDGTTGLSVGIGDLTMSCSNQFYYFNKEGQSKIRHSKSLDQKIKEIPNLISMALEQSNRMQDKYRNFTTHSVSDNDAHGLVKTILGVSKLSSVGVLSDVSTKTTNAMDSLYDMIRIEMAQKGKNAWGLHSGVTRWTTHEKSAPRRDNGRIESSMGGSNYKTNHLSLNFMSELVGV
jgi:phage/plasmid-like protein (TIGR03299 family)